MNAKLIVIKGAKAATIRLRLPTIIGRSPDASVKVPSTMVSRKHCEIVRSGNQLVVRDLGSANGTFVNDERIDEPTLLFEDDLLRVGPVIMQVAPEESAQEDRSKKTGPASPDVIADDEPNSAAGASSILNYRETDDGSFVGIEDFDAGEDVDEPEQQPQGPVEGQSAVDALGKLAGEQDVESAGDSAVRALDNVVEDDSQKIEGGDSALGDFFKNLD